jgi:hypothetical protein
MHVGWWEGRANCTQMGYLNVRVPEVKCWYCVKHSCGCYLLLLFSCNGTVEWYVLPVNYFNSLFCNTLLGFRCFSCCSLSKGYLMGPSMSVTFFCNSGTTYPFAVTHIRATVDLRFHCWNRLLLAVGSKGSICCKTVTWDHSATMTYLLWCEEQLWNVFVLHWVHLSSLANYICLYHIFKYLLSCIRGWKKCRWKEGRR